MQWYLSKSKKFIKVPNIYSKSQYAKNQVGWLDVLKKGMFLKHKNIQITLIQGI